MPLAVPPLRERRSDIPELAAYFLDLAAERLHKDACSLRSDAHDLLVNHPWPGNVRELENIITRASVLAVGATIGADDLRPWLIAAPDARPATAEETSLPVGTRLEDMERKIIEATLEQYGGHRAKTAEALGIGIRTLSGKLKAYGYAPRAKSFARAG